MPPQLRTGMPHTSNVLLRLYQNKEAEKRMRADPAYQLNQRRLEDYPEDRNYLLKQREEAERSRQLQYEADLLEYAKQSLEIIGYDEYPQYRANLLRFGFNEQALPESFATEEEFQAWKTKTLVGAPEYAKMQQGQPATMSKVNDNGTISEVQAKTPEEVKAYAEQGYQFGTIKGTPTKPQYDQLTIYGPNGETQRVSVEKGQDYTPPQGWTLQKPSQADRPDTPTTQQALKRISDIRKAQASLNKTNEVTAILAAMNPEFEGLIGQKIDPETKALLEQAWQDEIDYLSQFTGKSKTTPPPRQDFEYTATGENGEKIGWDGSAWVPIK